MNAIMPGGRGFLKYGRPEHHPRPPRPESGGLLFESWDDKAYW